MTKRADIKIRTYTVAGSEDVKGCRFYFEHDINPRMLKALQALKIDQELRGSNVVVKVTTLPSSRMLVELRSGYFRRGAEYKEHLAVKRVVKFLRQLADGVNANRGEIAKMTLIEWIHAKAPATMFAKREATPTEEKELTTQMRHVRRSDDRRINELIKYCLDTAIEMEYPPK